MRKFPLFVTAVFRHWISAVGGTVATAVGLIWEAVKGRLPTPPAIPPSLLWAGGIALLFGAAFQAWRDEHDGHEAVEVALKTVREERPRPFVIARYSEPRELFSDAVADNDEIAFHNVSDAVAFNVSARIDELPADIEVEFTWDKSTHNVLPVSRNRRSRCNLLPCSMSAKPIASGSTRHSRRSYARQRGRGHGIPGRLSFSIRTTEGARWKQCVK
jgi:hypothetical protein